ncbi:MAG TPA: hypothetical protein VHR39_06670, partial [Propionibacteriaceae bacterium]|nr:hypothetical protein [Propionibacteriaceae bacterium]
MRHATRLRRDGMVSPWARPPKRTAGASASFCARLGGGAFDQRVELIEGDVWPVVIGDWHGMVGKVIALLSGLSGEV